MSESDAVVRVLNLLNRVESGLPFLQIVKSLEDVTPSAEIREAIWRLVATEKATIDTENIVRIAATTTDTVPRAWWEEVKQRLAEYIRDADLGAKQGDKSAILAQIYFRQAYSLLQQIESRGKDE